MPRFQDLTGLRFGKLTVLECHRTHGRTPGGYKRRPWCLCLCECGNKTKTLSNSLREGNTRSCGCLRLENPPRPTIGYMGLGGYYFSGLKCEAKSRGIDFRVTAKAIWELFESQGRLCALSGEAIYLTLSNKDRAGNTASLDRIDSGLPYEIGNVQWVHKDVNKMKFDLRQSDFISWCRKISKISQKELDKLL